MHVEEAQREVRTAYAGGFAGQLVSGAVWLVAAVIGTWGMARSAMLALFLGGMCIFPVTVLALRLAGRRAGLGPGNPMDQLARQVAFTVPLNLPVAAAAALHRLDWFFPACMVIVGSHYLPFAFLYGMPQFLALGAVMVSAGLVLGLWAHGAFSLGAWCTAGLLVAFAFVGRAVAARESARPLR